MIGDIGAVLWKEAHELWRTGSGRGGKVGFVLLLAVFGVFWPWQFGLSLGTAAVWLWLPMMLIGQSIIDSFAGERERHTLDTLLATRLSARSIALGKLIAGVAYGALFTALILLLAMVTATITSPAGRPVTQQDLPVQQVGGVVAFSPAVLAGAAIVFVLVALLVASIAALVSMKSTVRQAGQTFGVAIAVIFLVPVVVAEFIPSGVRDVLGPALSRLGDAGGFALVVLVLLAIDAAVVFACLARFQRADLVLG